MSGAAARAVAAGWWLARRPEYGAVPTTSRTGLSGSTGPNGVPGGVADPWDGWGRVAIVGAMGQTVTCNTATDPGPGRASLRATRKGHHVENDVLRQAPLFSALDDEAAAALRSSMSENRLRRGEVLFHEGDPGDKLYIVTDGKVKLGRTSSDGRENLLAILGPGQMFGELSLFDPGPRSATVTAVTETTFLSLSHDDLLRWLEGRPGVSLGLLTQLAGRLRKTNEVVADLVFSDVPGRVAKALLDLADRFGRTADDGVHVHHDLTQEELAQLVGASRETVNKALADFASRGWLRLEPRSVVIHDVERLRRRARPLQTAAALPPGSRAVVGVDQATDGSWASCTPAAAAGADFLQMAAAVHQDHRDRDRDGERHRASRAAATRTTHPTPESDVTDPPPEHLGCAARPRRRRAPSGRTSSSRPCRSGCSSAPSRSAARRSGQRLVLDLDLVSDDAAQRRRRPAGSR